MTVRQTEDVDGSSLWCHGDEGSTDGGPCFRLSIGIGGTGEVDYMVSLDTADGMPVDSRRVMADTFRDLVALKHMAELNGIRKILHQTFISNRKGSLLDALHKISDCNER